MSHEIDEQLSALLDGELEPRDEARLRGAIERDPALARRLRELEGVDAALRALPTPAASPDLRARLQARIDASGGAISEPPPRRGRGHTAGGRRAPARRPGWQARVGLAAGLALAAALLAWLALPHPPTPGSTPAAQAPRAELPPPAPSIAEPSPSALPPESGDAATSLASQGAPDSSPAIAPSPPSPGADSSVGVGAGSSMANLSTEDVAVIEVLDWLDALGEIEPEAGRG